ncbi:MAG: YncE family protein [Actinomycetota bacterium]|nr:YncE family protein [Actinomycetota bacterium]MDP9486592.1 YncE family protein [Actinomycetota bacterium]
MNRLLRLSLVATTLVTLAGCGGPEGQSSEQGAAREESSAPAAEPAEPQPLEEEPAGEVVEIGGGPEGIVADPETGLVAVGLREPDELAIVDGGSGEVVRTVELPASPRHLGLAGPGGPVLVPVERGDALVRVGLPGGEILSETTVGKFPHDAAAGPDGRIFVANEFGDTLSVIEGDEVVETIDAPRQPGGVAVTESGLVGVIGVSALDLEVFDGETLESLGRVEAGEGPTHLSAGPDERFYVTDTRGDAVLIYESGPEPERIDRVPLSGQPYGIAVDPGRGHLWVTLTAENELVQFDLQGGTLRELARYPTVSEPNTVAVDTSSGRVFVAGRANGELQILDPRQGR